VKRVLSVVALLVALAPALSASGATRLSSQLLSGKELSRQWSTYIIANKDTATCPESNFASPTGETSARALFADTSTGTLLLEKLSTSPNPVALYDTLVERTLKCSKSSHALNGYITYQRVRSVQISGIVSQHRAFSLAAEAGGNSVAGSVVYVIKGNVVVAFAELSILRFNAPLFKTALEKALAKVTS
jgi:hypothetical protein